MATSSQQTYTNGHANSSLNNGTLLDLQINKLNRALIKSEEFAKFHGDTLLGDKVAKTGFVARLASGYDDFRRIFTGKNLPNLLRVASKFVTGGGLDMHSGASLIASMSNDSLARAAFVSKQVKAKYDRMLHPPITYLGDAFKYRTVDGSFNSAMNPHLGQAGAPYAKTVPSKTHELGARPDPGDIFDRLMAREPSGRPSTSGLSSMLIYHATIIIHDIFRTNDRDKNISDTSSYLDLSPLYGFTEEMQREIRDDKFKLGLLKPDTFAEDRLLRQPPGVCIMLVMYNRYHNYVATQLRRINENGRFSVPKDYGGAKLATLAEKLVDPKKKDKEYTDTLELYSKAWKNYKNTGMAESDAYTKAEKALQAIVDKYVDKEDQTEFNALYDAAWNKLDEDLFQTARLITCGMYIQVSIHDYLRALMGFHNWDTNFTLEPRVEMKGDGGATRGLGNQVTVEFNLLYRFHCAISQRDEDYTEKIIDEKFNIENDPKFDAKKIDLQQYMRAIELGRKSAEAQKKAARKAGKPIEKKDIAKPDKQEFGLGVSERAKAARAGKDKPPRCFERDPITNLFNDQDMIDELKECMNDPISNFGPRNVPLSLKAVEQLAIIQARQWEIGTLNDFRDFFGLKRHDTFESITPNVEVQNALRDLYDHPDKVELYPGVFCESDKDMGADPGPSDVDSALWAAIFSDAITLVRSDRFYTVDWNTKSLTSWGMKEVTENNEVCKSSVFHRLFQRAFPGWFPYDSIRFFHPFYTTAKNAELAKQQKYDAELPIIPERNDKGELTGRYTELVAPSKPEKPLYLLDLKNIDALFADKTDVIVHPARLHTAGLPKALKEVLEPKQKRDGGLALDDATKADTPEMKRYFTTLVEGIIKRKAITMDANTPTYQIDITRDFAIPVTTRYTADFLGIGHLVKSDTNPHAKYSENEIYQKINDCSIFLSYNADETKLLGRRKAFNSSMEFLYNLARQGNALEASRSSFSRWIMGLISHNKPNAMTKLGFQVAKRVLAHEKYDVDKTAAILLLVTLDSAYQSVSSFSSVLHYFINDMYDSIAAPTSKEAPKRKLNPETDWFQIQKLALQENDKGEDDMKAIVLDVECKSVKIPIIRRASEDHTLELADGRVEVLKKNQTILCDIGRAAEELKLHGSSENEKYITYRSNLAGKLASYRPKHILSMVLVTMIGHTAKMMNLRRGHATQGRLKRVRLDSSSEGYSNYMAPMRVNAIEHTVGIERENLRKSQLSPEEKKAKEQKLNQIYTKDVLKPETETFMTAEWDEFVPFPTTWKLRFDGFGKSDYLGHDGKTPFGLLGVNSMFDDVPPFYQPTGPSHSGGSFAQSSCVCQATGNECRCKDKSDVPTKTANASTPPKGVTNSDVLPGH